MLAVFEGWAGVAGLDLLYALDALERVEQAGQQEGLEVLVRGIYFCPELIGSRHFPALLLSLTTPDLPTLIQLISVLIQLISGFTSS